MMEEGVNFPLGCSEKVEKRVKRAQQEEIFEDLSLIFSIQSEAFFNGKVRLSQREQEVILELTVTPGY